ncbi:unknow [Vibrio parahaemolyticus]|nr:unknow [Vibrio parahaemolyticus]
MSTTKMIRHWWIENKSIKINKLRKPTLHEGSPSRFIDDQKKS